MFKGCCFGGGGVRGGGLKDSPDLSDNRRLRAVEPSGSKDTANGTSRGVAVEESFVPKDEVVDSQTVGTLRRTTAADVPSVVSVDGGVNASNPLPKDKEDSNGISIYSLIMSYQAFWRDSTSKSASLLQIGTCEEGIVVEVKVVVVLMWVIQIYV